MSIYTAETVIEAEVSLVVIRCACGDPESHFGTVCPQGIEEDLGVVAHHLTEDVGAVAYHHTSRIKRILWAVRHKLKGN